LFALIALILAAMGTYGVMSFVVAQRTREIGVCSALGATPARVVSLVVAQGMKLAVVGVLAGLAAALALTRLLATLLYDIETDVGTLAGISALLLLSMLAATLMPAAGAVRIPIARALRTE
jgi:ABC-type antimicrobial peptide transport system permease subunit